MTVLAVSLWLPVGRTNFYNPKADHEILTDAHAIGTTTCRVRPPYGIAQLQASVLRRVLEVLPRTFGYDVEGTCALSADIGDGTRAVDVVMTLDPRAAALGDRTGGHAGAGRDGDPGALRRLSDAGIGRVSLRVDERGNYTFTATETADADTPDTAEGTGTGVRIRAALRAHAQAVFGGDFMLNRLTAEARRGVANEGTAAIRRYSGLDLAHGTTMAGPPLGMLNFLQLNLIVEGLCNESLLPAVFFEHYDFVVNQWSNNRHGAAPLLQTVAELVDALTVDTDAADLDGRIVVLHRFFELTGHESLQRLKSSVESVRRSLLDAMMGVVHRQARLVQLNLSSSPALRTPELAEDATESQLRGYVMLVGAKLPVVSNAGVIADLAVRELEEETGWPTAGPYTGMVAELVTSQRQWRAVLDAVAANIQHLDNAVTHEWREKMLYEQEQARSEQEAMAEMERSRRGRLETTRIGSNAYNAIMLILTVLAVLYAVRSTNASPPASTTDWLRLVASLWPVVGIAAFFYLVIPALSLSRGWLKQRKGGSESYSYEFAFRLDEKTSAEMINGYLTGHRVRTFHGKPFRGLRLVSTGSGRIERISSDTTLMKIHSIVVFRPSPLRFARFEIVHEVFARTVAEHSQYFLRQSRVFGDSPVPLSAGELLLLSRFILEHTAKPFASDGLCVDELVALVEEAYDPIAARAARERRQVGPVAT